MTISNISLFDVYLSTLPYYSLCVCLCVCTQTMIPYTVSLSLSHLSVCPSLPLSVCLSVSLSHTHAHIHTNTHILAITNIFCVQCVLTAQLPFLLPPHTSSILPLQHGLHDCHSLLSPPPPHTHTHIAQPPRAVLTARLSGPCVCSAQLCRRSGGTMARSPEDCSVYFWETLHQQCPRDIFNSSAGAYDIV